MSVQRQRRRIRNRRGAAQLKARRYALGLKVADLAHQLGVQPTTVYAWERGDAKPEPPHYALLLKLLDLPEGALWHDIAEDDEQEIPA